MDEEKFIHLAFPTTNVIVVHDDKIRVANLNWDDDEDDESRPECHLCGQEIIDITENCLHNDTRYNVMYATPLISMFTMSVYFTV